MQLIFLQKNSKHLLLMVELDEDEDDSRPMPPDDDSVPDMEDSLIADGVDHEEVEEYINNNVSNDEVNNWDRIYFHVVI